MTIKKLALTSALIMGVGVVSSQAQYFEEDFNVGGTAGALDRGWEFTENEYVTEVGSNFFIAPEWPVREPGTNTGFFNPPTVDGTESDGGYLISDSDAGSGSDDIGSLSEIYAITPSFSTEGSGEVWFHADTEIESNNNGECIIVFDVTVDGGETWHPVWIGVEPERVIDAFNTPTDINGGPTGSVLTDGWPEIGSGSLTKTFNGIHGRWDIQLPEIAQNQPDVRLRFGWFEPADAWWYTLDNIVIDGNPAPEGDTVVLFEDFENGIPDTWSNTNLHTNRPAVAEGVELADPQLWDTRPIWFEDFDEPFKLVNGGPVNIDILRQAEFDGIELDLDNPHPDINPKGLLDGLWILMLAGQGYALWQEGPVEVPEGGASEAAALDTPLLDLSGAEAAFLAFDSELLVGNGASNYTVQLSTDGGETFEQIFTYHGALMNYAETAYFMRHYIPIPQAAGSSEAVVRFSAVGEDPGEMNGFWVIDNVSVTTGGTSTPVNKWSLY